MMRSILFILLSLITLLQSESFFVLNNVKNASLVTELQSDRFGDQHKKYMQDALYRTAQSLGIDTAGHYQRALALIVTHTYAGETFVLKSELVLGENVKRIDDGEKVYGFTYLDREETAIDAPKDTEALEEALEDSVDSLLDRFATQFREENRRKSEKTPIAQPAAETIRYETDYAVALTKAKKEDKNLLLILTTEYCPWCRKFEKNVLYKPDVYATIRQKHVPVILNRDKGAFPAKFTSTFTPVVYFIDAKNEETLHKVVGYNNKDEFLHLIE